jgi:peptide/nickel transport system permease protein
MPIWLSNLLILAAVAALVALLRAFLFNERSRRALNRLRRDRVGIACSAIIAILLLFGLADCLQISSRETVLDYAFRNVPREDGYSAPLARVTFNERDAQPLKGWHLLGTDLLGKDVLLQTLKGCRTALIIGGLTSLLYIPFGALLGIVGGYYRGRVDDLVQYLYSTLASIPGILLLVAVMMTLGKGLDRMAFALSLTAWIGLCRLVRGETFRQAAKPYVEAARALGQSHAKIILHHILPNVMHLVVINAILGFSGLVLTETILSYLGVGAPVGTASWGIMIDSARMELSREPAVWWPIAAASSALFALVLSLNLLGDSLRRAFDPKAA